MTAPENARRGDRDGLWWVIVATIAVTALVVAAVGVFLPATSRTVAAGAVAASPGGGASAAGSKTFAIEVGDLYVKPSSIDVPAGDSVTLAVTNRGALSHDLKLNGTTGTEMLAPGTSQTVDLGPIAASTEAWCTVPGHKAAGMVLKINVTGGTAANGHGEAAAAAAAATAAAAGTTENATIDPQATPPDGWTPRDPVLPPADPATVHTVTLEATEVEMEVAPGVKQLMWTFNNQVPGPILRGKVGDRFEITLVNKGTLGHSIDFHASKVAWNDEMRTIKPGERLQYDYTAEYAGFFMYHCGTAPTLHHIGNGMYGGIVVDPPDLPPVDQEFFVVQSELYLGPQGGVGDLTKMQHDDWDAVVFNGYHSQYKHAPIAVDVDKRYRVWVLDDGPSENSAFHIVGTVFDTVWKEGSYQLRPDGTHGGSQALDLQPAQGGFVEFTFAEQGYYPFVTHKFSNVGKGAIGLFAAGDPPPLGGGAGH